MLLNISIVILSFYSFCKFFFYYNFNIKVIDISNCIFIETFNKYKISKNLYKFLRFLLQNTNKIYVL